MARFKSEVAMRHPGEKSGRLLFRRLGKRYISFYKRRVLRSLLGPDDSLLLGEVAQHQYIKANTVLGNHSSKITPSTGQASELLGHTLHSLTIQQEP